ncbi:MAG: hypothetical protein HYS17_00730 [Micavibrio aeruginosavorus]|uniref:Uncharacterized protein n=1 Tax=Micavibrio aeruginosavorus TaxID=349221 RepID=A0A7T5R2H5_9BACT|nr:MAG: hypothetical protein HYS17_00730 [Micavibrio aeruginosavorus]
MALPKSISGEFAMSAEGSDVFAADSGLDAANDPSMGATVKPDLLQTIQRQVVDPGQDAANQPSFTATQAKAAQQYQDLTSKGPGGMGGALSAGSSMQAGAARQESAQKAATKLAGEATKLQKIATGADQPQAKPEAGPGGKMAGVAIGQGLNMMAAAGATVIAGPAAGAAVATAGMAYDVVKAFSGQSDGPSYFASKDSKGQTMGYGSSSSSAPQAEAAPAQNSVGNGFNRFMSRMPGERSIDNGSIETASDGLRGIEKAPKLDMKPLEMTPAAKALAGIFRNGREAAGGEGPNADKERLDFKPMDMKPNPGVFQAAAPKPFFG